MDLFIFKLDKNISGYIFSKNIILFNLNSFYNNELEKSNNTLHWTFFVTNHGLSKR